MTTMTDEMWMGHAPGECQNALCVIHSAEVRDANARKTMAPYDKMAEQLADMEASLLIMRRQLDAISETLIKADTTITKVAAEVMPTIEGLMKSPMLKMLMPKGTK
jgi:hypothetical protein